MEIERAFFKLAEAIRESGSEPVCSQTDPEAWYPETGGRSTNSNEAVKLCRTCPVINECLEYALVSNEIYGVWGGMTAIDRDRLKGRRKDVRRGRGRPSKESLISE